MVVLCRDLGRRSGNGRRNPAPLGRTACEDPCRKAPLLDSVLSMDWRSHHHSPVPRGLLACFPTPCLCPSAHLSSADRGRGASLAGTSGRPGTSAHPRSADLSHVEAGVFFGWTPVLDPSRDRVGYSCSRLARPPS